MGREIYNIINDMAEVLNASQLQKLQEVLVNLFYSKEVGGGVKGKFHSSKSGR